MTDFQLNAAERTALNKQAKKLRAAGRVPAVLYGNGVSTRSIEVEAQPFQKVWMGAGESTLIDVLLNGSPVKALIQDVQVDPVSGKVLHVDFHQVNMSEKLEVDIPLHFVGEAPAVKELGGTLVKNRDIVRVRCLPTDLVKEIDVDVSVLKTFDDKLALNAVALPKGLELLEENPEEAIIAQVEAPRTEEELAELDKAVEEDVSSVERVEKPKDDEAAAEEGAAPAESKT